MKGRVRGRWSWGVSLHHPFKAGLLSSCVLHSSHHGTELQSWQVTAGGKPWQAKKQTLMRTLHFINVQFNTAFGWAGKCILILLRLGAVQKWRTVVIATMTTKVTCLCLHKLLDRYNWMVLIGSLSQMDRLATVYWDSLMQVGTVDPKCQFICRLHVP